MGSTSTVMYSLEKLKKISRAVLRQIRIRIIFPNEQLLERTDLSPDPNYEINSTGIAQKGA